MLRTAELEWGGDREQYNDDDDDINICGSNVKNSRTGMRWR